MSGIELRVDLSLPKTWETFCAESPPFSVAIDGFVRCGPRYDLDGPRLCLNHHDGVSRLETRATCAQAKMAVRKGLYKRFRDENGPRAVVFAEDCDHDVCATWTVLKHPDLSEGAVNPMLNRLIEVEDMLDTTGGAYPFHPDMPILRQLAWVFQPYDVFRLEGGLAKRNPASYRSVIEDVESRILRHITGTGQEIPINTGFDVIGGGDGWAMVRETGAQARIGMMRRGIEVYLSVRDRPDGRITVTVGKLNPFARFDLGWFLRRMNELDGCSQDTWGGGNDIGGSPKAAGTAQPLSVLSSEMQAACRPVRSSAS